MTYEEFFEEVKRLNITVPEMVAIIKSSRSPGCSMEDMIDLARMWRETASLLGMSGSGMAAAYRDCANDLREVLDGNKEVLERLEQ